MIEMLLAIAVIGLVLAALFALAVTIQRKQNHVEFCNIGEGTHRNGNVSKLTDAALTTRYLLVKFGSDASHVAVNTDNDMPLGVCTDEASAAEQEKNVALLGNADGTLLMVANEAITAGEDVYTADDGKVQDLPGSSGTYYRVGVALQAASADGDRIEVQHCVPQAKIVS